MGKTATLANIGSVADGSLGFRNRIINGAMTFDQRNAGASVTPTSTSYTLDRWQATVDASSKFSVQQTPSATETGYATRVGAGFTNYLAVTSLSAYSASAAQAFLINQQIEGYSIADLAWGTSNAKTVTLSFWVRSSLTGTFAGCLENNDGIRSYVFTYTISSANTWEQKSITVAGDTTGTWLTTSGIGIRLRFDMGSGSNFQGTASAWQAADKFTVSSAVSVVGTNGATWYITGIQLEKGSTATAFDYRPYGTELALCQRYFETSYAIGTAVGTATDVSSCMWISNRNPGVPHTQVRYIVTKRATPTFTTYNTSTGASGSIRDLDAAANYAASWTRDGSTGGTLHNGTSIVLGNFLQYHYTASAEL